MNLKLLYLNQSTDYLLKKQIELATETSVECKRVAKIIEEVLEERELGIESDVDSLRPCEGVCDGRCGLECKNLL